MSDIIDNNIEKLLRIRLLHVLLFHMTGSYFQFSQKHHEKVVSNKISGLQHANVIKTNSLTKSFQEFCRLCRNN